MAFSAKWIVPSRGFCSNKYAGNDPDSLFRLMRTRSRDVNRDQSGNVPEICSLDTINHSNSGKNDISTGSVPTMLLGSPLLDAAKKNAKALE